MVARRASFAKSKPLLPPTANNQTGGYIRGSTSFLVPLPITAQLSCNKQTKHTIQHHHSVWAGHVIYSPSSGWSMERPTSTTQQHASFLSKYNTCSISSVYVSWTGQANKGSPLPCASLLHLNMSLSPLSPPRITASKSKRFNSQSLCFPACLCAVLNLRM